MTEKLAYEECIDFSKTMHDLPAGPSHERDVVIYYYALHGMLNSIASMQEMLSALPPGSAYDDAVKVLTMHRAQTDDIVRAIARLMKWPDGWVLTYKGSDQTPPTAVKLRTNIEG